MQTHDSTAPLHPTGEIEVLGLAGLSEPPHPPSAPFRTTALVLGGGVALGAFGAGAYAGLHDVRVPPVTWVCGSSIGAVLAAIIAGNAPDQRVGQLRRFWESVSSDPLPGISMWFGVPQSGALRDWHNQASVFETLFGGRPDLFRPRLAPGLRAGVGDVPALYDLEPLRTRLSELVDFDRLNAGAVRVTIATTDVRNGDRVVFDTGRGARIGPDHILASCALLPVFAPVEVDGRLLADGGLSSNTPLDLVLGDRDADGALCCVVDLFARMGQRPHTLAASASRATDLLFGNQTRRLLEAQLREHRLRDIVARLGAMLPDEARVDGDIATMLAEGRTNAPTVVYVGYRGAIDEAGPASMFDFSRATVGDRWEAGERAMRDGVASVAGGAPARDAPLHDLDANGEVTGPIA